MIDNPAHTKAPKSNQSYSRSSRLNSNTLASKIDSAPHRWLALQNLTIAVTLKLTYVS